jgi:hypothetical protein
MNLVKKEEEPTVLGFSHTRLGMEKTLERKVRRPETPARGSMQKGKN